MCEPQMTVIMADSYKSITSEIPVSRKRKAILSEVKLDKKPVPISNVHWKHPGIIFRKNHQRLHLYLRSVINCYFHALAFIVLLLSQLYIFALMTSTEAAFLHMISELKVQYFSFISWVKSNFVN